MYTATDQGKQYGRSPAPLVETMPENAAKLRYIALNRTPPRFQMMTAEKGTAAGRLFLVRRLFQKALFLTPLPYSP